MIAPMLSVELREERHVVMIRQRARQIAALLGFDSQDQTRIATAVSEIARNAFGYGGGGKAEFSWDPAAAGLVVRISDRGPGIADLEPILEGRRRSSTGLGLGIIGARRLMDGFEIESGPGRGTTVRLVKILPRHPGGRPAPNLAHVAAELARSTPQDPLLEIQQQNREMLRALEDLRGREAELAQLNRELEDTNRGVVALYAELDEKADALVQVSELKSQFLANMSHEFRTPMSSILNLTWLLLSHADGPLTPEQEKQIQLIRRSAQSLMEMVNDLLDLAKIEAGKSNVRVSEFAISDVFGALRGMFNPVLPSQGVALIFEQPADCPILRTDEGKLSQILRNLISNALKFTPDGVVRVQAVCAQDQVNITVRDTGIGIAREHQDAVFQEFHQIEGGLHKQGTGLGLPLSRRLANLLGGTLSLQSEPGTGSTFSVRIPLIYPGPTREEQPPAVPEGTHVHHA